MVSPSGFFIEQGLDPSGAGTAEFLIPQARVRHFLRNGPKHKFFESLCLPPILQCPSVIFRGLGREELDRGWCYAGIPQQRYLEHNITAPPPPGFTFAVFADADFKVFDWRWEKSDPEAPDYPIEWKTRFKERKWFR